MSTFAQGTDLTLTYVTTVNGVPTDASTIPVITFQKKGDHTAVTVVVLAKVATGTYEPPSAIAFTAAQVTVNGTYVVGIYNAATEIDQPFYDPQTWSVGVNYVSQLATDAITAASLASDAVGEIAAGVWDRLTSAVVTAGSMGVYILTQLGLIGDTVTIVSPLNPETMQIDNIVQGNDYKYVDSRALFQTVTFTNAPSFVGGSVSLKVTRSGNTPFTKAGTVLTATTLYVDLSATDTASLAATFHTYDLNVTLANGDVVTVATGQFNVVGRVA